MGWGIRILVLLIALWALAYGGWIISLLAFVYVAFSLRRKGHVNDSLVRSRGQLSARGSRGRYAIGTALLLLSTVALGSGGRASPLVLGAAGLGVLMWPEFRTTKLLSRLSPVKDSVLLRSSVFPFVWSCLSEVKLEPDNAMRAVSCLDGRIILFAGKTPSLFLWTRVFALRYNEAEEKLLSNLRRVSVRVSPRGGYLLPLESSAAASRLSRNLERIDLESDIIEVAASLPFDVLMLEAEKGRINSFGTFRGFDDSKVSPWLPGANQRPARRPLVTEVAELVGEKSGWPDSDAYVSFLSAMHASRREPFGDGLESVGRSGEALVVESLGGTKVDLARPQLRALVEIYS